MAILEPGKPVPIWVYSAGAAGLFVVYYLWSSSKKKAAAAVSASKAPAMAAATSSTTPVVPASSYGTGQNAGALSNIEQQLQNLNASQATTQGATPGSGVAGTADNEMLSGSGYYPNENVSGGGHAAPISANGHTYRWVPNPTVASALGWNNLFYQPVPGLFVQNTAGTPLSGNPPTPLFAQVT